jgi:glycosyltransferase involved in cell wall biosynthesis
MTGTKFDVAITTFRRPDMVVAAVRSCLLQGDRLNSVVVVDDASGDDTGKKIAALGDPRIVFHERATNGGIGAARGDAMARCISEWTVMLDSDHELLPGALERLALHIATLPPAVGIVGARHRWDTGGVTPARLPEETIDYRGRIEWASLPDSIGTDYVCCVSRHVRQNVTWSTERSGAVDALFQLDAARVAQASFLPDCLALQRSDGAFSHSRGDAQYLLASRVRDAAGGVAACRQILLTHEHALRCWGRPLLARIYKMGILFAVLAGDHVLARRWTRSALLTCGPRLIGPRVVLASIIGGKLFRLAYLRTIRRAQSHPPSATVAASSGGDRSSSWAANHPGQHTKVAKARRHRARG